jgi:hypothetical protein
LKLKVSPHKARLGALKNGFHFLGIDFQENTEENKVVKNSVNTVKKEK